MHKFILLRLIVIAAAALPAAAQSSAVTAGPVPATSPPVIAPPAAGSPAPAFDAPDQDGVRHALKGFAGRPVLLAFYPKDFTGGWTKELSQLRDDYQKFTAKRIAVLAISLDDAESHRKFRKKYQLPFPLLVDADKAMTRAYGVQKHMELGGEAFDYAGRSLFLIGPDGKVAYADPDFKLTDAGWKALFAAVAKLPKPAKSVKKIQK